jgi:hypothetical protein
MSPSTTESNGRDPQTGRFLLGNRVAIGNPHAQRVAKLRAALLNGVSESDVKSVIRKMVELAKGGDAIAARLVLDRCLGRPEPLDILARLEALEAQLGDTS